MAVAKRKLSPAAQHCLDTFDDLHEHRSGNGRLKPCPFCGGVGEVNKTCYGRPVMKWVKCCRCEATGTSYEKYDDAIEAWNRRV